MNIPCAMDVAELLVQMLGLLCCRTCRTKICAVTHWIVFPITGNSAFNCNFGYNWKVGYLGNVVCKELNWGYFNLLQLHVSIRKRVCNITLSQLQTGIDVAKKNCEGWILAGFH